MGLSKHQKLIVETCARADRTLPASRFISMNQKLFNDSTPPEVYSNMARLLNAAFHVSISNHEMRQLTTPAAIEGFLLSQKRGLCLTQEQAKAIHTSLSALVGLDLRKFETVIKVPKTWRTGLATTEVEEVPVRIRWIAFSNRDELKIEFRPVDMTMDEHGDETTEIYNDVLDFVRAYEL